jgi:hypothetical protein
VVVVVVSKSERFADQAPVAHARALNNVMMKKGVFGEHPLSGVCVVLYGVFSSHLQRVCVVFSPTKVVVLWWSRVSALLIKRRSRMRVRLMM